MQRNKILIADDEEAVRGSHARALKDVFKGMEVEPFDDGDALEQRLKRDVSDVAVIIADKDIRGVSGNEIIRKYANRFEFENIFFILSHRGEEDYGRRAVSDGAFAHLTRSYSPFLLLGVVGKAIKKYNSQKRS